LNRKQQSVDKYSNLRYNPNWKNREEVAEKACEVAGGSSRESFYLHSSGFSEEESQQEAKSQDIFPELLSFHEPNARDSKEPFRLHTKGKKSAAGCFRGSARASGSTFSLQSEGGRPQRAKTNFVEKNKRTLGLRSEINSYLQLCTKRQEVLQEQVGQQSWDIGGHSVEKCVSFPHKLMQPQQHHHLLSAPFVFADHQNKPSQRTEIKSNQDLKWGPLPRNPSQQPPGRPAEPVSWHHQTPEFWAVPRQAVKQDDSKMLQKWRRASPVGSDTSTAKNSDTCLNNYPNSKHFVNQAYQQHLYNHGFPQDQQHLYNHVTKQLFPRGDNTKGQAHPNQRNISSTFNANFQGLVKDQVSLQDCKRQLHVDKRHQNYAVGSLWPSQPSIHSLPTAPCATFQNTPLMEQHHQEITQLPDVHFTDRCLFRPLPPIIPQVESSSEVDSGSSGGNQVKINRRNSGGYLMQTEKQKQPKIRKKANQSLLFVFQPYSSKPYINLDLKLGGLGPDYEAIKEKREKLQQQKEYAKQIKEYNMRNITSAQRSPAEYQATGSVSRQKALEYAKKIPRPRTFTARRVEEKVLLQDLNRDRLPQITSLETLQNRHEKEKQVIAAFKMLHIL
ncbi:JHY protein, partial [Brachypteracias leptosomus]|nr:JHY protein [Brachypteracias leptosomus]